MDREAWRLQSMGLQRVGYDLATKQQHVCMCICTYMYTHTYIYIHLHKYRNTSLSCEVYPRNVGLVQHLKINQCNLLIN